jgi:predicted ATPase/DNA-binding CsgD family transcriptional regulator/transcriptional regulator with XRE-family HTH domain
MTGPLTFGAWLKQLRATQDLTQERLAEQVGCAVQTIRSFETGLRRPSRELLQRLAEVLQVSAEQRPLFMDLGRTPVSNNSLIYASSLPALSAPQSIRQLPTLSVPLIGRMSERHDIARRIRDPYNAQRIISIIGPGGIGKSHLALQLATDLAPHFIHGACFIELAALVQASEVIPTIAQALGLQLMGNNPEQLLLQALAPLELLLVLDNAEHLLEASPLFAEISRQAPNVRLLITSRERLRLHNEWTVELRGLSLPVTQHNNDIQQSEAAQLFLETTRRMGNSIPLNPQNRIALLRICHLLEGMPLALELAASWTRTLCFSEIADEIARNADFLVNTNHSTNPRHSSMQVVVEDSWRLLSPDEQQILAQLSVFRNGAYRTAIQETVEVQPYSHLLNILANLIDKSLLRRNLEQTQTPRYSMHEVVRQFAWQKLQEYPGQPERIHEQHACYFATLLQQNLKLLRNPQRTNIWGELHHDLDNMRQAWDWSVHNQRYDLLHKMGRSLRSIYEDIGFFNEAQQLFAQASQMLHTLLRQQRNNDILITLGEMLGHQGYFSARCGDFTAAKGLLEQSLAYLGQDAPSDLSCEMQYSFGLISYQLGYYNQAIEVLSECCAACDQEHNIYLHGLATHALALALAAQGKYAQAEQISQQGLPEWRNYGSPRVLCCGLSTYSFVLLAQQKTAAARNALQECLQISSANRDRWSVGFALLPLGKAALAEGQLVEARYLCGESIDIFRELGDRWSLGLALLAANQVAITDNDTRQAHKYLRELIQLGQEGNLTPILLETASQMAQMLQNHGHSAHASELYVLVAYSEQSELHLRKHAKQQLQQLRANLPPHPGRVQTSLAQILSEKLALLHDPKHNPIRTEIVTINVQHNPLGNEGIFIEHTGETLTPREVDVLRLLMMGASNPQIAQQLVISLHTVKTHVAHILSKLRVGNRSEAMVRARDLNLIEV